MSVSFKEPCRIYSGGNSIKDLTIVWTIADMASLTKTRTIFPNRRAKVGMYFVKEFEVEPDKLLALTFEPKFSKL